MKSGSSAFYYFLTYSRVLTVSFVDPNPRTPPFFNPPNPPYPTPFDDVFKFKFSPKAVNGYNEDASLIYP
jgi:hypothetical protein